MVVARYLRPRHAVSEQNQYKKSGCKAVPSSSLSGWRPSCSGGAGPLFATPLVVSIWPGPCPAVFVLPTAFTLKYIHALGPQLITDSISFGKVTLYPCLLSINEHIENVVVRRRTVT